MPHVALYTFGIMHEEWGHPRMDGFEERVGPIFAAAAETPGALQWDGAGTDPVGRPGAAGDPPAPSARTLTVWSDLDTVFAFVYQGVHAEALRKRREWFRAGPWPSHCLWWVEDGHVPTWEEAVACYERLHAHGPTAFAFTFGSRFNADGLPTAVRRPGAAKD